MFEIYNIPIYFWLELTEIGLWMINFPSRFALPWVTSITGQFISTLIFSLKWLSYLYSM